MPTYEVDYEYIIPQYGVTTVVADNMDAAENVALDQLQETMEPEVEGIRIEAIKELKQ